MDEARCDFDDTLRNMLGTPPVARRKTEPQNDGDDVVEPHEGEEAVPDEDERG